MLPPHPEKILQLGLSASSLQGHVQGSLADAAALAAAWRVSPETAPFHGLRIHLVPPPGSSGSGRGKVLSTLVQRLGGELVAASKCDVCVLCGGGQGGGGRTHASAVRCKAGAALVADTWVTEAVAAASRPDIEDHAVSA